jgi:cytidine deaminase
MTDQELIELARSARDRAYAPYSGFRVGAALLCADGRVFLGCNIENAAYPAGLCAERAALAAAVTAGAREFTQIVIAGSGREPCTPCGICRQSFYEFAPKLRVICAGLGDAFEVYTLCELLPGGFGPGSLT